MKKLFTLMLAVFAMVGMVNAKTKTTKVLWEGTHSDNIAIEASSLQADATITVYMSWTDSDKDGTHVRAFYTDTNGNQAKFKDGESGSGTITDWNWQNKGTESYAFTIAESDMKILNNNTQSQGKLYIGSADLGIMKITMITLTTTASETETSTTSIWTGSHPLKEWNSLQLTGSEYIDDDKLANAKIGDVIRVTYKTESDGSILLQNNMFVGDLFKASVSTTSVDATVEYEIFSATVLEAIQQKGIAVNGTNAVLSAVELLSYSSSYDAVSITVGSDGIATYSNGNKNVQISACDALKAYYASDVTTGIVTLTELTCIPADKGAIVKGTAGTYTVKVGSDGWEDLTSKNYLKPSNGGKTIDASTDGAYRYIFAKKNNVDNSVGFYKLESEHTLAAHKAYLETTWDITPTPSFSRGITLDFGDGTTAILKVIDDGDARQIENNDGKYYTLQGTSVQTPTKKGLYIVNGKKVLVK